MWLTGNENGEVVDYCGVLKNLRKALATFAGHMGEEIIDEESIQPETDPLRSNEILLKELVERIKLIKKFLEERGECLSDIYEKTGFEKYGAIKRAKEAINENDETRKRFGIMAREVFKKFKACVNIEGVNDYRYDYDAINQLYKSLQKDRDEADITAIIRELHGIVDAVVEPQKGSAAMVQAPYDISKIDFDKLRREFEKSDKKNTTVQALKDAIEKKLERMLKQNPFRTDFRVRYEEIIAGYNHEKDQVTIEKTFDELLKINNGLDDEARRAIREGLDEESLALFDLLKKNDLSKNEIKKIKEVAVALLATLKEEKLKIENWREKTTTRDDLKRAIHDFLWDSETGLPSSAYSETDVTTKTDVVFLRILNHYATPNPAIYASKFH